MSEQKLREALQKLRSYNVSIAAGQINYRPEDHIAIIDKALQPSTSDEGTPTEMPDKYCVTTPDGDCVSTDPRCMHNSGPTASGAPMTNAEAQMFDGTPNCFPKGTWWMPAHRIAELERTLHAKERELAATRRDADDWMQKYTYETMELDEVKAVQVAEAKKHDKVLCDIFARRVRVEETLLKMAAGKLPLPDAAKCRELAIVLGVPSEAQSVSAAPQVKHKVTCKLFPDPYDEREPVGPCTCGAAPQEGKADERIEGRPTAHFEGHEPTGA